MLQANSRRSAAAVVLVLFATAVSLIAPIGAGADPVDEKRAEAQREADKLHELEVNAEMLTEEFNDAVLKQQQLQTEVDAATARADEAKVELEKRREEVAEFAVGAYVRGGTEVQVPSPLQVDPTVSGKLQEYADHALGDRPELIKQFRKAKADAEKQIKDLNEAKAQAEELSKTVDGKMKEAQAAVDEQEKRRNQVQGELAVLVQQEMDSRSGTTNTRPARVSGPPPPVGQGASFAVQAAKTQLGVPYKWGGSSPSTGFDCSGFVLWAWKHGGKNLPHSSRSMYSMSTKIPLSEAQPGDLVFYGKPSVHHVALYIGGGQIIHSPGSGKVVHITTVNYWNQFVAVGRI